MKREKQFSKPLTRLLMAETPFLRCKGSLDGNRRRPRRAILMSRQTIEDINLGDRLKR